MAPFLLSARFYRHVEVNPKSLWFSRRNNSTFHSPASYCHFIKILYQAVNFISGRSFYRVKHRRLKARLPPSAGKRCRAGLSRRFWALDATESFRFHLISPDTLINPKKTVTALSRDGQDWEERFNWDRYLGSRHQLGYWLENATE